MRKAVAGGGGRAVAARGTAATLRRKQPVRRTKAAVARPVAPAPVAVAARRGTPVSNVAAKAPVAKVPTRISLVRSAPPPPVRPISVMTPSPRVESVPSQSDNPFMSLLLAKRRELSGSLEVTRFDTLAKLGRVAEDDQAQLSHEEFISVKRNSMDYQSLRMVNAAIERLNSGDFGVCASCDEPISEKRLKAIPWAKYCVVCQDRVQANGGVDDLAGDDSDSDSW